MLWTIRSNGSRGLGGRTDLQDFGSLMQSIDNWPRTIQANLCRFYERIILPATGNAPIHDEIITGVAPDMGTFFDRAKAQINNYTANEANKAYALVLVTLFERYLRLWARAILADPAVDTQRGDLMLLLDKVSKKQILTSLHKICGRRSKRFY